LKRGLEDYRLMGRDTVKRLKAEDAAAAAAAANAEEATETETP